MDPTRASLAPCIACQSHDSTSGDSPIAGPCCDESCLETVARRQCALQCGGEETSSSSSSSSSDRAPTALGKPESSLLPIPSRKRKREACSNHSRSVREKYATILSKVGCICRELIARNLEPCCQKGRSTSTRSTTVAPRTYSDAEKELSCTGTDKDTCGRTDLSSDCSLVKKNNSERTKGKNDSCGSKKPTGFWVKQESNCCSVAKEDSCSSVKNENERSSRGNKCSAAKEDTCGEHGDSKVTAPSGQSCCNTLANKVTAGDEAKAASRCGAGVSDLDGFIEEGCCDEHGLCSRKQTSFDNLNEKVPDNLDIEKGDLVVEHVALDVQGLTCVGCETKLFRSLRGIPGVRNLHTSLVLSRAEFDFDQKAGPIADVIKSVEKATGFACHRLNSDGQDIDVIVDGDTKTFVEQKYPDGVTQMNVVDNHVARITYDAQVIGARALLETSFDSPLKLAAPRSSSEYESGKKHVQKTAWITLLSTILTIPVLVLAWAPLSSPPIVNGGVSLALATIVQFAIAGPFYPSALRALIFTHVIEVDLLVVLSTSTAYIFSIVAFAYQVVGRPLSTKEFFGTSTLLVTLIMLGRLVSAFARHKAVKSVSIRSLQAQKAVLWHGDAHDEEIDARLLQYGDFFKVTPDSRITTDGMVISGMTEVDESMMTGEPMPVEKLPGSPVIAGSLNGSGVIIVRLTRLPGHNTISTIAAMVDEAKFSKPKIQKLVDVVASYFVPTILTLTLIIFAIWIGIGISVRHQNSSRAVTNAITYAVSVLIVSCPCAIGLAVPMVVVIAGGVAAKHGVIFKSAMAIETARKVSHVVLDKTGTLTEGQLSVVDEIYLSDKYEFGFAMSTTLGLTSNNNHPVSAAISTYLRGKGFDVAKIKDFQSITGRGVKGFSNGVNVQCGNTRWLSAEMLPDVQNLLTKGLTVFGVAMEGQLVVIFGLSDSLRPDSYSVITELQRRNIAVSIVSGDDAGAVELVATKLGIPLGYVRSRYTAADKQEYLKNLVADGKQTILFCGDGTNDAVALAQADIGVHMNGGSDVAQTAADVVLVRPYLGGILVLLDLSKAAFHRIFFNFAWSFVYNLFAILLAGGAFVNVRISPQYAGLGEIVSVLPVILIALQLRWFKRKY